jgi:hypothetical protein
VGFEWDTTFAMLFGLVLLVRCLLPFAIFRYPLPGIIGCLVVDAIDQTVFQNFGYDPPFYQGYDKAMDVFYLGIAYIATLRNWTNIRAFGVSRFLFFYRQVGVVAFELTQTRALLMVFPNTFEYFFIAYEAIRTRWNPAALLRRFWIFAAAGIWILIKLPQEYWIHIAQLDFTDAWQDVSWFAPLVVLLAVVALLALWFVVRPRLRQFDHGWQFTAPPIPDEVSTAAQRAEFAAAHDRVWSIASLEKFALIGLLSVIFASVLPGLDVSLIRTMLWVGFFVLVNSAISLRRARRGSFIDSIYVSFVLRMTSNLVPLVLVDRIWLESLPLGGATFFVLLFSVLITAYDLYRPVLEYRIRAAAEQAAPGAGTS